MLLAQAVDRKLKNFVKPPVAKVRNDDSSSRTDPTAWSGYLFLSPCPICGVTIRQRRGIIDLWQGKMQDIGDWLKRIGLDRYTQRFVENGIDISVLRHLSDQDLKEIG